MALAVKTGSDRIASVGNINVQAAVTSTTAKMSLGALLHTTKDTKKLQVPIATFPTTTHKFSELDLLFKFLFCLIFSSKIIFPEGLR